MLNAHEIVNDTIGSTPIAVTWCPLCSTAIVFSRNVGKRVVTFGIEGVLWRDNQVMYDRQTGSLWSQGKGEVIRGDLHGTRLQLIGSSMVTWKEWRSLHPDTLVLVKQTERDKEVDGRKSYRTSDAIGVTGRTHSGGPLGPKVLVVGFHVAGRAYAVPLDDLKNPGFLQFDADGSQAIVVATPDRLSAKVFLAGSEQFTKAETNGAQVILTDQKSGSSWDGLNGRAIDGKLKGQRIEELPASTAFWYSWYSFNPGAKVLRP
jgi:hypothetical protein